MNVLPLLEMSMSNEQFNLFYKSILDENIFLACWTFAKTGGGKGWTQASESIGSLFSFETRTNSVPMIQVQETCACWEEKRAQPSAERDMCGIFMYSITYCKQKYWVYVIVHTRNDTNSWCFWDAGFIPQDRIVSRNSFNFSYEMIKIWNEHNYILYENK